MEHTTYVQDGFIYYSEEDAKRSALEVKKIEYMETRMDYSKPEQIHKIYEKAIEEGVFQSMPGLCYLKRLQDYLLSQEEIAPESVSPIPSGKGDRVASVPVRREKQKEESGEKTKKLSGGFVVSIITNIALVIAVIIMFVIALDSNNPNILNYEEALQNKYADWEMKLMEREQAVREKEREYHLEDPIYPEE